MMEYEPREISPSNAFFLLMGLVLVGLFIGALAGMGVWAAMTGQGLFTIEKDMLKPQYANAARVLQAVSVLFMLFLPGVIIARVINRSPFKWLGYTEGFNWKQFMLVIIILAACVPLIGALGELNQVIPLTKAMEARMKKFENNYTAETEALATIRSSGEFIFSLFVMALLPAVFEETLFRGGLQQILINWFKKPIAAIIVTSIIFSLVHISWYGFLPRFALGMVLGLIFYYSKSIWLNMALHFLNNAMAVVFMYYLSAHNKPVKDAMDDNTPIWMGIPALIAVIFLFRYFKQESAKRLINKIPPMDGSSIESNLV